MKIKPQGERLLVEAAEPKVEKVGGIHIPEASQEASKEFIVVAMGSGVTKDPLKSDSDVKVGAKILMVAYAANTPIKDGDKEYRIVHINDVLAVIEE